MKFEITKQFIVLKVDTKEKVDLYTLIDTKDGDKIVTVGIKEPGIKSRDLVEATLALKTKNERFDTKTDGVKFVETLNIFVSKIGKVSK